MSGPEASNDFANGMNGADLKRLETNGSIMLTQEMFEAMYLAPQNRVKGELRSIVGNPTPMGLAGFLMAYTPLIIQFLGWRGAGGLGIATIGTLYFFGGMLAIIAAVGEFILGNSFPVTFFGVFGAWFLYYGVTLTPSYGAITQLATDPSDPASGATSPEFLASTGFVSVFMALFSFFCMLCALRVNVLFVIAFLILTLVFGVVGGGQIAGASGNLAAYQHLLFVGGAIGFVDVIVGWYLLLVLMLSTVDFPLPLPVGDLSTVVKSRTDLMKNKQK